MQVDWWALGISIFEMLSGYPPIFGPEKYEMYKKITDQDLDILEQMPK